MAAADLLKLEPVALARALTLAMQTPMIKANITAYSVAVGPSSLARKRLVFCQRFNTGGSLRRGLSGRRVYGADENCLVSKT